MKLLNEEYDLSSIIAGVVYDDIKYILLALRKEGFDRVVGRTNQYGYPKYQWALLPGEEPPGAYLTKPRSQVWELPNE